MPCSLLRAGVLALALGACSSGQQQAGLAEPDTLKITAWNIEHLTAEEGAGCAPRTGAELDLVAETIRRVDADIWLLQEVDGEDALARVFGDGWTFHVEDRQPAGTYPLCRGREDGARLRAQNTAIAIRSDIPHERLADISALDLRGDRRTRYGVAISLSGDAPIDIVSVHLASGCFAGDSAESCPLLFGQAGVLEEWIDARSAEGRAVIAGGDFNRRLEADGDPVWAGLNDGTPQGLHVAGAGTGPSCDPRYSAFIDFLVMNEAARARKLEGSFTETLFSEDARASDHCPISFRLRR